MFDYTEEKVRVIERTSKHTWAGPYTATIKTHKADKSRKLIWKGHELVLGDTAKHEHLLKLRMFNRYRKVFFVENDSIVEPGESVTTAWSGLITASDVQKEDEAATLAELSKPSRTRNEQLGLIITYIAVGAMAGYLVGQFLPLAHFTAGAASQVTTTGVVVPH
jgi:hypothetical protein